MVIAAVVVGISMSGTPPTVAGQAVTVYIDTKEQTGNYTLPQTLDWGAISQGNTYTKNFTVVNNVAQPLTLKLYTTEPTGCTHSWSKNGSTIPANGVFLSTTLVLTLNDTASTGKSTWRLLAVNGTSVTPTPTPTTTPSVTPTPTPTPNALNFTVDGDLGVKNLTITVNNLTPFTLEYNDLPKTYAYTMGDTIRFNCGVEEGYEFAGWQFGDGSVPIADNPLTLTDKTAAHGHATNMNFTLTALTREVTA